MTGPLRASVLLGIALALAVGVGVYSFVGADSGPPVDGGESPQPVEGSGVPSVAVTELDQAVVDPLAGLPPLDPKDDKESREVVAFAAAAGLSDVPGLERMLEVEQPLVVGNAVRALGRLGLFTPGSKYARFLNDERVRVRQESVRALGLCGDAAAVPHLVRVLESGSSDERRLALEALGEIGGDAAQDALGRVVPTDETERAFHKRALLRAARNLRTPG